MGDKRNINTPLMETYLIQTKIAKMSEKEKQGRLKEIISVLKENPSQEVRDKLSKEIDIFSEFYTNDDFEVDVKPKIRTKKPSKESSYDNYADYCDYCDYSDGF